MDDNFDYLSDFSNDGTIKTHNILNIRKAGYNFEPSPPKAPDEALMRSASDQFLTERQIPEENYQQRQIVSIKRQKSHQVRRYNK